MHDAIHKSIVFMGEISGGVIKMSDVFGVNETNRIVNYDIFLSNLFAFGTGYCEFNVDHQFYNRAD